MKKLLLILPIIFLIGCKKTDNAVSSDDTNTEIVAIQEITGIISNWDSQTSNNVIWFCDGTSTKLVSSTVNTDGSFRISLSTVKIPTLTAISTEGIPSGIYVSKANARLSSVCWPGFYDTDGFFREMTYRNDTYEYLYFYCDSDLILRGDVTNDGVRLNYDVTFKLGWNKIRSTILGSGNGTYKEMTNKIITDGIWIK